MIEFRLPDVGEGLEEAEVIRWLVEPGEHVARDQPIVEIQTDKALVEIPAPAAGTVTRHGAEAGAIIKVGHLLFVLEADAGEVGEGEAGLDVRIEDREAEERGRQEAAWAIGGAPPEGPHRIRPRAAPAVRRLATELGIELTAIQGTGPGGRVVAEDVRRTAEGTAPAAEAPVADELAPRRAAAEAARTEAASPGGESARTLGQGPPGRLPIAGVRRVIAQTMTRAWTTIPHIHGHDEIDALPLVDAVRGLRRRVAQRDASDGFASRGRPSPGDPDPAPEGAGSAARERAELLTLSVFFVMAAARALRRFPLVNASIDLENHQIVIHEEVNVGLAVATPVGLIVPVVRGADELGLHQLAAEIDRLARAARERKVTPDELRGGTFTVTNFGSLGGRFASPIIRPPEVGILGFGAIRERPWVVGGRIEPRPVLPMSFGADHRLIDGDLSVAFQEHVRALLSDPVHLLLGE
ncbi:MAG TPA: dihydrolipoamide acetyltransferase family protein [Thermoanaerobaculia bacterium]|nr:dihydrolipoamide acetyltransferase family protein [Thermoanaerobaculia bacterium]